MELEQLRQQLSALDKGQAEILRRIDDMAEDLKNTMIEIGGVPGELGRDPDRESIRRRLHRLENDKTTAKIAATAVDAAKALHEASIRKRFSRREKLLGLVLAAIVAIGPYLAPFLHPG